MAYKVRKKIFFDLINFTGKSFSWYACFLSTLFIYFLWNFWFINKFQKKKKNFFLKYFLYFGIAFDFGSSALGKFNSSSVMFSMPSFFTILLKIIIFLLGLHFFLIISSLLVRWIDSFEWDFSANKEFPVFQNFLFSFIIFMSRLSKQSVLVLCNKLT